MEKIIRTKGTYTYPDGSKYEGYLVNGKPDGIGTCIDTHGGKDTGEFKDGLPHGNIIRNNPDGSTWESNYTYGFADGIGNYTSVEGYKNQQVYDSGDFECHINSPLKKCEDGEYRYVLATP